MQHLLHVLCLGLIAAAIYVIPFPAVIAVVGVPLLAYAQLANRTRKTQIAGSTVLVTGASSGLGREFAVDAAARGAARILLVARSEERLAETAARIAEVAPAAETFSLPCDLTDAQSVEALCARVIEEHGAPDVLINNAGAGAWLHIEETSSADVLNHTACPYLGAAWLCRGLIPAMAERGSGHIVNVTSVSSLAGFRAAVTYGTARWAMRGFSQYLRADVVDLGIGVTLFNAAEIAGTSYFDNAEGKAGAESHSRIPTLFQTPLVTMFTTDAAQSARVCLAGVETGIHEILHPYVLAVPTLVFVGLLPDAFHHVIRFGSAGRRAGRITQGR